VIYELEPYVKRKDVIGFLRQYLRMYVEGRDISLPSGLDLEQAKEGWLEILPKIVSEFSSEFVGKLGPYWVALIKKQGGGESDNMARDLLNIVYNNPDSVFKLAEPSAKIEVTVTSSPVQGDSISSGISTRYYGDSKPTFSSKEEILATCTYYIKQEDHDSFLLTYLSLIFINIKPQLPLSTVHDVISSQWETLISREFKCTASDVFLLKLSSTWFYVVHLKGIPLTLEHVRDIFNYLKAHRHLSPVKTSENTAPSKKNFLQKWFRWKI
jgi:hypothetical protein